jgi:UDP-glucose-4-epimerase GalE
MSQSNILVSGGAGYIGSHACYALKKAGYQPIVIDDLSTGNKWAASFGPLEESDIGEPEFIRKICRKYEPIAAMHFAAFIEVGESTKNPTKYYENNRDKASRFFRTLNSCGVKKVVFSSTAAVYGECSGPEPLTELQSTAPINPYGQSKLEAEAFLRMLDGGGMRSVTLRYFNVAGAAPADVQIGETHMPETHLIPRLVLPLMDAPLDIQEGLGLGRGFTIYGTDYPTPDGTAIRDYIHVTDLIDAHMKALDYLLSGGATDIFNLGSGKGFSVKEIVEATRKAMKRPGFQPGRAARREGDSAVLVASNEKASIILGWKPERTLEDIIADAAAWHGSKRYQESIRKKIEKWKLENLDAANEQALEAKNDSVPDIDDLPDLDDLPDPTDLDTLPELTDP